MTRRAGVKRRSLWKYTRSAAEFPHPGHFDLRRVVTGSTHQLRTLMTSSERTPSEPSSSDRLAFLRTLTMLAVLSTASEVRHGILERRAGRDPSDQEEAELAVEALEEAAEELAGHLMRIRSSLVISVVEGEEGAVAPARHMLVVLRFNRVQRLLQRIHQGLLSLYPTIPGELAEEARVFLSQCQRIMHDELEASYEEQVLLIDHLLDFAVRMARTVRIVS